MQALGSILVAILQWVGGLLAAYAGGKSAARSDAREAIAEVKDAQAREATRDRGPDAVVGRMRDGTF
ncbi:MAG: hypothetical protein AB7P02_23390 [Alphaproteobacteria bacterium]